MKIEAYDILTKKGNIPPEQAIAILWVIDMAIEDAKVRGHFVGAAAMTLEARVSALEAGLRAVNGRLHLLPG